MNTPHRWRRAWASRRVLAETAVALLLAEARVRWRARQRLAAALGRPQSAAVAPDAAQVVIAREVAWAVAALCSRWPWRIVCLPQALAAQAVLRRRRVPCALHLGLTRDSRGRLQAHAWLRCGSFCVTGGEMAAAHAEVAAFR